MIPEYFLYINGDFRDTGDRADVLNPADGSVIARVALAGDAEVEDAIAAARAAFDAGPWKTLPLAERARLIRALGQGILDRAGEFAQLETLNAGKPIKESTFMDVPSAAKTFQFFADNLEKYLRPADYDLEPFVRAELMHEPQGVVVLIVPWNYPLLIASWKMAAALAAGNTVILKPSSRTPLTALELARVAHSCGLPRGVVNVLNASGGAVGEKLCSDKRVDMISFTGGNEVGRQIMNYSSTHVKKLIMELGGKSASIVLDDADLELAVNGSLCSIFLNQGQMCTAMSRIFVQDGVYDAFIRDFTDKARRIKLGDGRDFQTQLGPLISREQRDRVAEYVQRARDEGARVLCGGVVPADEGLGQGYFFPPTILEGVTPAMSVYDEEVFGPVACVNRFSSADDAVRRANESEFALAAAVWSADPAAARRLAARLNAGIVWINTYGMFYNEVPYGGFKRSGFGKELGREGFLEYCRLKNVVIDATRESKPIVNYWYGF